MARYYRDFARRPRLADPEQRVRERYAARTRTFLQLAEAAVFRQPANPYFELFRLAGCGLADLKDSVEREGLEPALQKLCDAGIRLSHAEFKGHTPIVRGGKEIRARPADFSNPLVTSGVVGFSSGSRSHGTPSRHSVEWMLERESEWAHQLRLLGAEDALHVNLLSMLPATPGLVRAAFAARHQRSAAWFTLGGTLSDSWHYRALSLFMALAVRSAGLRIRFPTFLVDDDFGPAADFVARLNQQGRPVLVESIVSPAGRLADAARSRGLSLNRTTFLLAGEALTDAHRALIHATGATAISSYIVSEVGLIGMGCAELDRDNAVHIMDSGLVVFSRKKVAPLTDCELNSLVFTTVARHGPYFLINAETDDAGDIEPAPCDCALSRFGYRRVIRNLFSYGKLTGQGTTLLGTDVLRILLERLPARFGGVPGDYQLAESGNGAQSTVELRVHPRLGQVNESAVRDFFLAQVKALWGGAVTRREWTQTGGFRVVIAKPFVTATGKVQPLHLMGFEGKAKP
ncbi:MAG: hypothetical protein FJW34_10600 [Acidobacteria bacterium]|nr:hypothetical protein [Acidobacteriota bacterium]